MLYRIREREREQGSGKKIPDKMIKKIFEKMKNLEKFA